MLLTSKLNHYEIAMFPKAQTLMKIHGAFHVTIKKQ